MQEVQATNNERVFEGMHHVMLGDVFKSVRYPNFTQVEKGNTLTVVSAGGGEAVAEVRDSLGLLVDPAYKVKINHIINGYFEFTGVDMTVINSKYVRKMCSVMGIEYLSIPEELRTTLLNTESKATVNQMLAVYKEDQLQNQPPLPPALEQALVAAHAATLEQTKRNKLAQIEAYRRDARTHYARYESYEESAREAMLEYEALDNSAPSTLLADGLRQVLSAGWYKLHEVQANRVVLTTPEIMLKHGTIDVNLGQLTVALRLPSLSINVGRYANTLDVNGYFHPHVGGSALCMGNAHTAIQRAAENQDIAKLLGLVKEILTNYNPDSPYVSISRFNDASLKESRLVSIQTNYMYQEYGKDWYLLSKLDIPKEVLPEGTPLIEYDSEEHGPDSVAVYVTIHRKRSASGDTLGYYVKDDAGNMHKVHSRYTISHSEIEDFDVYQAAYSSNEQEDEDEGDE